MLQLCQKEQANLELKRIKQLKKQINMASDPDMRFRLILHLNRMYKRLVAMDTEAFLKEIFSRCRYRQDSDLHLSNYEINLMIKEWVDNSECN